ncbi:MAG: PspA/IM30 family protein [Thermosynechococcaceae cyanobacterium MS004]|nr:PspA/IM30 family protein [Thermosynechococcaceae cyanobacterium MS004]
MVDPSFNSLKPKKVLYWLMGDQAGRTLSGTWNWLWGIPLEQGGKISEEIAREALAAMEDSVLELKKAVAKVMAVHQQAQATYEGKQKECREAEHHALLATRSGNQEAARLAMTRAIKIEEVLPHLLERILKVEGLLKSSKEKLRHEQEHLEALRLDMENMTALTNVNQAMSTINGLQQNLKLSPAQHQFSSAKTAIEQRHAEVDAIAELLESPAEQLNAEMGRMVLDEELTRRLRLLAEGYE